MPSGAETLDLGAIEEGLGVAEPVRDLTDGRGADSVIDAVGMEAHGSPAASAVQKFAGLLPDAVAEPLLKTAGLDRLAALHTAIDAVRRGGTSCWPCSSTTTRGCGHRRHPSPPSRRGTEGLPAVPEEGGRHGEGRLQTLTTSTGPVPGGPANHWHSCLGRRSGTSLMVLPQRMADAGPVKKILLVVAAVVAAFIVLKIVFALVSALVGALLFFGVLALLGFGVFSVMRFVTRARRDRSLV